MKTATKQFINLQRSPLSMLFLVLSIAGSSFVTGCNGPQKKELSVLPNASEAEALRYTEEVFAVKPGRSESDSLVGYLGHVIRGEFPNEVHLTYIYDRTFKQKGFYTASGSTFVFDHAGKPIRRGHFNATQALEQVLNVKGVFRFNRIRK